VVLLTIGVQELQRVFEFIGVPIDAENVAAIYKRHQFENMKQDGRGVHNFALPKEFFRKGEAGDWRNSLNPGQRYLFYETAGDLLCALGYSDDLWWFDHPYQRMTVPLRAMLSSRSRMKMKAVEMIKRALGPKWTERIRGARSRSRGKDTLQATVNG
jgi:hypothetical protein